MKVLIMIVMFIGLSACQVEIAGVVGVDETVEVTEEEIENGGFIVTNTARDFFVVSNGTDEDQVIELGLNGETFFSSKDDILKLIDRENNLLDSPLPFERAIWDFVAKNSSHDLPISSHYWVHTPTIYFNSVGFGLCDDVAANFMLLAVEAGYDARVWGLSGHVVPEVFANGKWQLLDPDYGVFFENEYGEPASIEELAANPTLFDNVKGSNSAMQFFNENKELYIDIVTTTDNNQVSEWYKNTYNDKAPVFTIPQGGKIEFPSVFAPQPSKHISASTDKYAHLKLTVPNGFAGVVDNNLVLTAIKGHGEVIVNGEVISINSEYRPFMIDNSKRFISIIEVVNSYSDIELIYMVNPNRFFLNEGENSISIKGQGADFVGVKLNGS